MFDKNRIINTESLNIPLPKIKKILNSELNQNRFFNSTTSFLSSLWNFILTLEIDDLIIIGLILLLIDEGMINDIAVIILVYLFLCKFE